MKKLFYAICALGVLCAVGCSKEDTTPSPEYQVVVNMEKPLFGDQARAARNAWENGDQVYVFFHGDYGYEKYLKLTYNAGAWASQWVGTTAEAVAAKETKELRAGYLNLMAGEPWAPFVGWLAFSAGDVGVCYMQCDNGTYTVVGDKITLNIVMEPQCAQVTVRGIEVDGNWTLCCSEMVQTSGFSIVESGSISAANGDRNGLLAGFANADGVSFFGVADAYSPSTLVFTLSNGVKTYKRTFTEKVLVNGKAIAMDGPTIAPAKWEEVAE